MSFKCSCSVTAVLLLTSGLYAQTQPPRYYSLTCSKLQPGKTQADYKQFLDTYTKKAIQTQMETGGLSTWYLLRSIYPSGSEARCTYMTVSAYNGAPPAPLGLERMGAILQKSGSGITSSEYIAKRNALTSLVSSELWRTVVLTGELQKGDYLYVNSMKVHNGNEWMDMEQKIWKPMAESWIKSGKMRAWGVSVPVIPAGTDLKYQATTIDVYPSWEAIFDARPLVETFKTVHPNENIDQTFEKMGKVRDLARRELFVIDEKLSASGAAVLSKK